VRQVQVREVRRVDVAVGEAAALRRVRSSSR